MGREETSRTTKPCPCGKGLIVNTSWQYEDWIGGGSSISVDCPDCKPFCKIVQKGTSKGEIVNYLIDTRTGAVLGFE